MNFRFDFKDKVLLACLFIVAYSVGAMAGPPPPPAVPIDAGISVLVVAAVGYGATNMRKKEADDSESI